MKTAMTNKKYWLVFILIIAIFIFAGCFLNKSPADSHIGGVENIDYERLKTLTAKYNIHGTRYDVPLGYLRVASIKYGYWPTPKESYLETTAFSFQAALPDMQPYSEATRDKFEKKKGHGDIVDILVQPLLKPRKKTFKEYLSRFAYNRAEPSDNAPNLVHFIHDRFGERSYEDIDDVYVPETLDNTTWFIIICNRPRLGTIYYPSCGVQYYNQFDLEIPSVLIEYSYGLEHLTNWEEIHEELTSLVASFNTRKPNE